MRLQDSPGLLETLRRVEIRTADRFELVHLERVEPREQERLGRLADDPDVYGVLRPRTGRGTYKTVGRDLALLWYTLRDPGPLPAFMREDAEAKTLAKLVLDGVFEIAHGDTFVSGPATLEALDLPEDSKNGGLLNRLSRDALRYAAALPIRRVDRLAARLYAYRRAPLSSRWRKRLPNGEAVLRFLDAGQGVQTRRQTHFWSLPPEETVGWLYWQSRGWREHDADAPVYKLYLSPEIEALPEAVAALIDVLSTHPPCRFKIGSDAAGLLRPDKAVAYFDHLEDLHSAADKLETGLSGLPVQGVPFTAEAGAGGLLSWGLDPPASRHFLYADGRESWRGWITRRLATYLVSADGDAKLSWRFALERLRLTGVDTDRWTPSLAMWGLT